MAKKPKTIGETIAEGVDKILHPKPSENSEVKKENKSVSLKNDMGKHIKFDKFKTGDT